MHIKVPHSVPSSVGSRHLENIHRDIHTVRWSDLALVVIFEKLHFSADQVDF